MAILFFVRTGLQMIDTLPQKQKMDPEYFAEYREYNTIIDFDLLTKRKDLPTEKMSCSF
jgi:hypothetical protein